MMAEKVNLVSLGDSIATGTLTPFSRTYSYVFYLGEKFRGKGYRWNLYNLAQDGNTSNDLLWKLNHSRQFRGIIKKADFITISIGGNDLLKASSIPGFASINVHMAKQGTTNFIRNWPRIVQEIRHINPHGKIVALNIYNPYNHTGYDKKLYELTDRFLTQINTTIISYAEDRYNVADVYAAFEPFSKGKMHRVSCLYPETIMRNPHPTPGGQRLIADLVFKQFDL